MGIKKPKKDKVSIYNIQHNVEEAKCLSHPVFCFRYMTHNSKYNFEYYKTAQANEKSRVMVELFNRLNAISQTDWTTIHLQAKNTGVEYIPFEELSFRPHVAGKNVFTKDIKYISIRFDSQKKRLIGIKRDKCAVFHIIGFDFDFSAYNHGK